MPIMANVRNGSKADIRCASLKVDEAFHSVVTDLVGAMVKQIG